MADLFEVTSERLTYKFYTDAAIDPTTEAVAASDPAATGGQILRHVSHNMSLDKNSYGGKEIRTDKQMPMSKDGSRQVPIAINGLLSPLTYKDLFAAAVGGTWSASAISKTQAELTSMAADVSAYTLTAGGGDPVAEGFKVGDIVRALTLSDTDNNSKNFFIRGFSGSNNRTISVYPAPDTMTADTSFTLATAGRSLYMPASAHVKRKVAFEVYNSDGDIARLFTEARMSGFDFSIAPDQDAQINFSGLGRNRVVYDAATAPFFTSPTAETTTDLIGSMDGVLQLNGSIVGVCTGLSIKYNRAPTAPKQIHPQGLAAGILLDDAVISGDFTVFLKDRTFLDLFDDPTTRKATEFELFAYLPVSAAAAAAAMVIYLPRIKINSNAESTIEGAKAIQCGFAAARYLGSGVGIDSTSIRLVDTEVT